MHTRLMILLATAVAVHLCAACAGSPSLQRSEDVSIRLYDEAEYQLIMHGGRKPKHDMNAASGAAGMAMAGFSDCAKIGDPFTALFLGSLCAAGGAIIGGVAGASVSAIDSIGDVDAPPGSLGPGVPSIDVRQAWHEKLRQSLDNNGRERGKSIVEYPDGETLHVVAGEFLWDVKSAEEIAMVTTVLVAVGDDGKFARKQFTLSGPHLSLDEWRANDGKRVKAEVDAFADRISDRVWNLVH